MKKLVFAMLVLILGLNVALAYTRTVKALGIGMVITTKEGTEVTLTPTTEEIKGWEVEEGNVEIANNQFTMPGEDVTISAIEEETYIFKLIFPYFTKQEDRKAGEVISVEALTENEDYIFKDWTVQGITITEEQKTNPIIEFTMPENAVTVIANYIEARQEYTVTFDANGGSGIMESQTFVLGTAQNLTLNAFTKSGYKFVGWATTLDATTSEFTDGQSYNGTENITLYAVWTIDTYTITYDLDGGTVNGNPGTYDIYTEDITLRNPTKEGYSFIGWTGSNGETPSTAVTIVKGSTGNKEYTANWEINTYTVTFNSNDGTSTTTTQMFVHGIEQALELNTFTRKGYRFIGWSTTASGSVEYTNGSSYTATGTATLYAIWEAREYTLTITGEDSNGHYVTRNGTKLTTGTYTCTIDDEIDFVVSGLSVTAKVELNGEVVDEYTDKKWSKDYTLNMTGDTNIVISSTNILLYKTVSFVIGMVEMSEDGEFELRIAGMDDAYAYVTYNGAMLPTGVYRCSAGDVLGFVASGTISTAYVDVNETQVDSYEDNSWRNNYTLTIAGDTTVIVDIPSTPASGVFSGAAYFGVGTITGAREGAYTLTVAGDSSVYGYPTLNDVLIVPGTYKCDVGDVLGFKTINSITPEIFVNGVEKNSSYTLTIAGDTAVLTEVTASTLVNGSGVLFDVGTIEGAREGEYTLTVAGTNSSKCYVTINGIFVLTGEYKCTSSDILGFVVTANADASITLNGTTMATHSGETKSWNTNYTLPITKNTQVVVSFSSSLISGSEGNFTVSN